MNDKKSEINLRKDGEMNENYVILEELRNPIKINRLIYIIGEMRYHMKSINNELENAEEGFSLDYLEENLNTMLGFIKWFRNEYKERTE